MNVQLHVQMLHYAFYQSSNLYDVCYFQYAGSILTVC